MRSVIPNNANGCLGGCCERFTMNHTPEQRAKSISAEEHGEIYWMDNMADIEHCWKELLRDSYSPIQYIHDMIIELPADDNGTRWYTCRHWNKETRLCMEYESRPGLCRDFPYGKKCFVKGCKCK